MTQIKNLLNQRNNFTEIEIDKISSYMFDAFILDKNNLQKSIEVKTKMLEGFIEIMQRYLYSDLITSSQQKLSVTDLLDKLIIQKEIFCLLNSTDEKIKKEMLAAKSFSKKSNNAIGL